ncbi:hypothetical protein Taro_004454 [Colocasia esculenta]|uniref:Glucose-methanol-choline oxidoreductase N-terminal domain-containing protein n=1 Tax=Colocasia esculenta TaxID=4460 RepID=A0A843TI83_COLES|nr:hypothetical protein [Colocasia esculenta]
MKNITVTLQVSYYDYIVVGNGMARCPIATTLSKSFGVLLLEQGDSTYDKPNIACVVYYLNTLLTSPSTRPPSSSSLRTAFSEDNIINAHTCVLGGGTCINTGFYSQSPWDTSATLDGMAPWSTKVTDGWSRQ